MERVHQTIGNILCTFQIQEMDLDNENSWEGILSSSLFAIATVYGAHYYTAYTFTTGIW